ncbi:hypothetical protein FB45DRAFT_1027769 [Roridomyces roridus]|uniref:Uncharacterized protein n=1 Tax=Roridomyces roridus TaxID=1738132 RepID=A0AAD7BTQ0_9AGAR|nr:hypothetical protein FB45DRAFT_1027769 [Roridomyces roridus]
MLLPLDTQMADDVLVEDRDSIFDDDPVLPLTRDEIEAFSRIRALLAQHSSSLGQHLGCGHVAALFPMVPAEYTDEFHERFPDLKMTVWDDVCLLDIEGQTPYGDILVMRRGDSWLEVSFEVLHEPVATQHYRVRLAPDVWICESRQQTAERIADFTKGALVLGWNSCHIDDTVFRNWMALLPSGIASGLSHRSTSLFWAARQILMEIFPLENCQLGTLYKRLFGDEGLETPTAEDGKVEDRRLIKCRKDVAKLVAIVRRLLEMGRRPMAKDLWDLSCLVDLSTQVEQGWNQATQVRWVLARAEEVLGRRRM